VKVKVGVNGYGTIGKRVAWAISKQDDMEVVGVTKTRPSFEADIAVKEGHPLYAACQHYGGQVAEELFHHGICLPSSSNLSVRPGEASRLSLIRPPILNFTALAPVDSTPRT